MPRDDAGFYFALPRLCSRLLGGKGERSERSAVEAFGVGVWMYFIHFGYAALALRLNDLSVASLLLIVLVAAAVWIWWLLIFYANSLVAKLLAMTPAFRSMPLREIASMIFCAETTLIAIALTRANSIFRWLALAWLIAVVLNGVAAIVIASRATR